MFIVQYITLLLVLKHINLLRFNNMHFVKLPGRTDVLFSMGFAKGFGTT